MKEIFVYFFVRTHRVKELDQEFYVRLPDGARGPGWIYCTNAVTEFVADNICSWRNKASRSLRFILWYFDMPWQFRGIKFEKDQIR